MIKMMATIMKNESLDDKIFLSFIFLILLAAVTLTIYPLWYVLIASISNPDLVYSGRVLLWPKEFTLEAYQALWNDDSLMRGYLNSVVYTLLGTTVSVFLTMIAGFALSQPKLWGRNLVLILITVTMFFNGGLVPTYLVIKKLGMLNTMWALILPNAVWIWNLFLVRNFYLHSLPQELQEAAIVDGASFVAYFYRIALPLSRAILSVMVLYYALGYWNMYFQALIYLNEEKKYPLQMILRNILLENQLGSGMEGGDAASAAAKQRLADLLKYSSVVAGSLPLLITYPFLQKYFEKGVLIGSVKG